jgi:hypothetical protein
MAARDVPALLRMIGLIDQEPYLKMMKGARSKP